MKKWLLPVFIIVLLAQWIVPGSMIYQREEVLRKGKAFRFQTEPVDPSNPFKGRYVALNFKEDHFTFPGTKSNFESGQEVYVGIAVNKDGFAHITNLYAQEPTAGTDYINAKVYYPSVEDSNTVTIYLRYPFSEFYMDEYKAPKAETIYRESTIDSSKVTYALIKVWKGRTVIQNVYIGDKTIGELANER